MAWLITLALFLWIGGAICKLIDVQSASKSRQIMRTQDAQEEFVANLYVLGWNHYQELEGPVLNAASSAGLRDIYFYQLEKYSEALNGKAISEMAIEMALCDMVRHNEPLFCYDTNATFDDPVSSKLTPIKVATTSYAAENAAKWEQDVLYDGDHIGWFENFFDFALAEKVKSDWIKRQIPQYDDRRVYLDPFGSRKVHTPDDYEETIKERRQLEQACAKAKADREANQKQ